MPKQPDLIARAAQADPQISESVKDEARSDYTKSVSGTEEERKQALEQLRKLAALSAQDGVQMVVGSAPRRAKRRRFSRNGG